jgi:hypothetical protein
MPAPVRDTFFIGTVRPASEIIANIVGSVGKVYRRRSQPRTPVSANFTDVGVSVGLQRRVRYKIHYPASCTVSNKFFDVPYGTSPMPVRSY